MKIPRIFFHYVPLTIRLQIVYDIVFKLEKNLTFLLFKFTTRYCKMNYDILHYETLASFHLNLNSYI